MRRPAILTAITLLGCTSTVLPAGSSDAGDVVIPSDEAQRTDAPPPTDGNGSSADASSPSDGSAPQDAPSSVDLTGRWRLVRYRFTGADGREIEASDEPTIYTDPGTGFMTPLRANGYLRLGRQRFAMSLALLANEHIRSSGVEMGVDTFSATGVVAPGLLEGSTRFAVSGGMAAYELEALDGGRLRVRFSTRGPMVELERTGDAPGVAQVNAVGAVERLRPDTQRPMLHPRVAIFWLRPAIRGLSERNGVALRFTEAWAQYPLVLSEAPEEGVRFSVSEVPLATAMILVYDDRDDDRVMNLAGGDALRGISNITLVWRGAGGDPAGAAFRQSAFADLGVGYHFAWRTRDFSTGGVTLLPFDGTRPISPDAPVSPTEIDPAAIEAAWR